MLSRLSSGGYARWFKADAIQTEAFTTGSVRSFGLSQRRISLAGVRPPLAPIQMTFAPNSRSATLRATKPRRARDTSHAMHVGRRRAGAPRAGEGAARDRFHDRLGWAYDYTIARISRGSGDQSRGARTA